jgi:hypothetical protein
MAQKTGQGLEREWLDMTILTSGPISGAPDVPYSSAVSYSDLLVDVGEYTGRNDIAAVFPLLLRLAEAKLNRNLRTAYQETTVALPMVNGVATLPSDFLEARAYTSDAATFNRFVISGNVITANSPWTGDLTMTYYASIPPLSLVNPSNWLLDLDYNVYLYALAVEVGIWAKTLEIVQAASELRDSAISTVMLNDENARWGRARVVNRDLTP